MVSIFFLRQLYRVLCTNQFDYCQFKNLKIKIIIGVSLLPFRPTLRVIWTWNLRGNAVDIGKSNQVSPAIFFSSNVNSPYYNNINIALRGWHNKLTRVLRCTYEYAWAINYSEWSRDLPTERRISQNGLNNIYFFHLSRLYLFLLFFIKKKHNNVCL